MGKILYSSAEIRREIVKLFRSTNGRRVAISAFVGDGADAFLPKPHGLHLYCWPKAGGTNPRMLRKLMKRGVEVYFADALHMKVYWSESIGGIITSANLSKNALGSGDQKEIGILLKSDELDIARVITSIKPRPVSSKELFELDRLYKADYVRNPPKNGRKQRNNYLEWYEEPFREEWKLASCEGYCPLSSTAKKKSIEEYDVDIPNYWLNSAKEDYKENDWILTFTLKRSPKEIRWLYVDYIVDIPDTDKKAYTNECPCQVVQVYSNNRYPAPPFKIREKQFTAAFKKACKEFGVKKINELKGTEPPKKLTDLVYQYYKI
jgi:hypothetical protein